MIPNLRNINLRNYKDQNDSEWLVLMVTMYSVLIDWFWDHITCLAISREDLISDDVKKHCFDEIFLSVTPDKDLE